MKIPPPITVAERAIEMAWDTPDDQARVVLEQSHWTIVRMAKRTMRLARLLERAEAQLEAYRSRDPEAL